MENEIWKCEGGWGTALRCVRPGDNLILTKALLASTDGPEVLLVCQGDSKPTEDSWESFSPSWLKLCWRDFGQQLLTVW